ncbi:MAG: methyl-accepting chemotaxis protein [Methylococcales bacterium]
MKNRRKQLIVDGNFQYRFVMIGILVSFSLINMTILFGFFLVEEELFDASPKVVYSVSVALMEICALVFVFIFSLRSSHRIAGPLAQVKNSLQKIGEGNLVTKTQFRQQDHFHDVGIQLNQTTEHLRHRISIIKEAVADLDSQIQEDSTAKDALKSVQQHLNKFKTEKLKVESTVEAFDPSTAEVVTESANYHQ